MLNDEFDFAINDCLAAAERLLWAFSKSKSILNGYTDTDRMEKDLKEVKRKLEFIKRDGRFLRNVLTARYIDELGEYFLELDKIIRKAASESKDFKADQSYRYFRDEPVNILYHILKMRDSIKLRENVEFLEQYYNRG